MLYIETFICWLLLPGEWNCHPSVQIFLLEKCRLCTLKTTWFVPRTLGLCLSFSYCLWFPGDHIAGMLAVSVASSRTLEVLDLEGTGLTNQSAQVYYKLRTTSRNMGIFEYIYSNKLLYTHTHTQYMYIYIYIYIYIHTGVKSTWNHSWVKVQIPQWKLLHYMLQVTNSKTTWVKVLVYLILTVLKYFNYTKYRLKSTRHASQKL